MGTPNSQPKKVPTNKPPVFAEIFAHTDSQTWVRLVVFGRYADQKSFSGMYHETAAERWANNWNAHLEKEWTEVKDTTAALMEGFSKQLEARGVSRDVINAAVQGMDVELFKNG